MKTIDILKEEMEEVEKERDELIIDINSSINQRLRSEGLKSKYWTLRKVIKMLEGETK